MSEPFLSEIKIVSFNFPPKGWTLCNGQLMPIAQNQALFSLIGTTYGGDGRVNFALPNLQGRLPIHMGQGFTIGEAAGTTSVTLISTQMPAHNHFAQGNNTNGIAGLAGITPDTTKAVSQAIVSLPNSQTTPAQLYGTGPFDRVMAPAEISSNGGSQPHTNVMPFLTLNFIIALQGIYPSRS
jgi:microcystin-dependent protein